MSKIASADPTVKNSLGSCWVYFFQWQFFELRLYVINFHSHLCQWCHDCLFGTGKDRISLCQSIQIVTMRLHSLDNSVQVLYCLAMLFRWGWQYNIDLLYRRCISPFDCGGERYPLLTMVLVENVLKPAHVLRLVVFRLHSWMYLLKVAVCDKLVITVDTITELSIIWPPTHENSLPFSNFLIKRARGSVGSYGPIIFTAFSLRSISSIEP